MPRHRQIRRLEREEATAAGVQAGAQRRRPTAAELKRWSETPNLLRAFRTGQRRGRERAARLEQLRLRGL